MVDNLQSVNPEQREINTLHQLNIDAEKTAYQGAEDTVEFYKGNVNENQILENTELLTDKYEDFLEERAKLMEKYDVYLMKTAIQATA